MSKKYDFAGWATKNNLLCSDGRVIMRDAFKDCDGKIVPLVWNHRHDDPDNVLGHAMLENHSDGVRTYGIFNDTERGRNAKKLVDNGDIVSLSIYANNLKQNGRNVMHGVIREVSLVLGGANPGAFIDSVNLVHSEDSEDDEAIIYTGEGILAHSSEEEDDGITLNHSSDEEDTNKKEEKEKTEVATEKTIKDVFDTLNEEQKTAVYAIVGQAIEDAKGERDEEDNEDMKHNVFDSYDEQDNYLSHADEQNIINMAKSSSVGTLQEAIAIYSEENGSLAHGIDADDLNYLFPEYKDLKPGAPELLTRDQGWVTTVMNGVHKSPISRIRTKQMDARDLQNNRKLRGLGHTKGDQKTLMGNPKLLKRTTDPQTIYIKDEMHRDDIIDITDFDVVEYEYGLMRMIMNEEIARAIMISDGREDEDPDKISEDHIRSIWHDDDLYSIKVDIDIAGTTAELQGTNTTANFGKNYIYAESMVNAALYARENYKGSGKLAYYCDPHSLNMMLLARDLNGRRIYSDVEDLAKALNVSAIYTAEQFAGKTRTVVVNGVERTKKLHGIFVDISDYQLGSTKGGEITRFDQFDIDFNKQKYMIETRLSGALTKPYSAIVIEEDVTSNP